MKKQFFLFEKFLSENNLINNNQFGFITKSSTLAAFTQLLSFIETNLVRQKANSRMFFIKDITKAYDSVQRNILLKKLENIGIKHIALKLFQSFHNNRKQFIKNNLSRSQTSFITNRGT